MILSSAIRAYVYSQAVDMRKSIDALSQIVAASMGRDPLSGHPSSTLCSPPEPSCAPERPVQSIGYERQAGHLQEFL